MTDDTKPIVDPVVDPAPAKEPKVEEVVSEEPKAEKEVPETPKTEKPVDAPAALKDEEATPAGVDQSGRQLYNITCSACGKQAQVPFKPSGDRPVYCRDCYMKQRK